MTPSPSETRLSWRRMCASSWATTPSSSSSSIRATSSASSTIIGLRMPTAQAPPGQDATTAIGGTGTFMRAAVAPAMARTRRDEVVRRSNAPTAPRWVRRNVRRRHAIRAPAIVAQRPTRIGTAIGAKWR